MSIIIYVIRNGNTGLRETSSDSPRVTQWLKDSGGKPKSLTPNFVPFLIIMLKKLNLTISRSFRLLTSPCLGIQCRLGACLLHMAAVECRIQVGHWRSAQPLIQEINGVPSSNALLDLLVSFKISLTIDKPSFLAPFLYSLLLQLKTVKKTWFIFYPLEFTQIVVSVNAISIFHQGLECTEFNSQYWFSHFW